MNLQIKIGEDASRMAHSFCLDFCHFHVGIHVVHVFVLFQSVFWPDGTKPFEPFGEKSPDMTRLVEWAKAQFFTHGHSGIVALSAPARSLALLQIHLT
jgi:hypothetical protein